MIPRPKKHLSQNYLSDPNILGRIIDASGVTEDDTVVEIGPGPGAMTAILLKRAKRVIAIEVDHELHAHLDAELGMKENLLLIRADALKFPFSSVGEPFKVVANIPYHITSPIIFKLLEEADLLKSMTLTIQREVAERLVAKPGNKDYGVMTLMVRLMGEASLRFIVPAGAFRPRPKVDSACVNIVIDRKYLSMVRDPERLRRIVKAAFSQRRKTLHNSLKQVMDDPNPALLAAGIDPIRRPETLSITEFIRLADASPVR